MSQKNKTILYTILLLLGLSTFILQIFVFEYPDGILGLIVCIISIYLVLGSIMKLCKLSKKFKNVLKNTVDILFWLP